MSQADRMDLTMDNTLPPTADALRQLESSGDPHMKRVRVFTEKKFQEFQSRVGRVEQQIKDQWNIVSSFINFKENDDLYTTESDLNAESRKCFDLIDHYLDYLHDCYTSESLELYRKVQDDRTLKRISVERAMIRLERAKARLEVASLHTRSIVNFQASNHSNRSNHSSASAEDKRAKAEAARAAIGFLDEEASLKKKALDIETELRRVSLQKEAAMADAAAGALDGNVVKSELAQRHLDEQRRINGISSTLDNIGSTLRPEAAAFQPRYHNTGSQDPSHQPGCANIHNSQQCAPTYHSNDFVTFMLKKEVLSKRKWEFDDTPESYQVWKSNFLRSMRDMDVDETDQVDLMIRYLGSRSKVSVLRIRNANPHNPVRALRLIWERLDECFGTPEMLESALKLRISNFPKITVKEPKRLYELADLLSEVASLKDDPVNATQFAYYESASGVKPIVCKLPPSLQEKWTSRAAKYQTTHHVEFPPFSEFLQFVKEMARIKNNPSFMYDTQQSSGQQYRLKTQMVKQIDTKKTSADEPEVQTKIISCPYHESSNHTLNQCRAFRVMAIEKRRQFLRTKKVCLKCCEIQKHDFRKCLRKVTCNVCQREHPTALHEDQEEDKRPTQIKNVSTLHGGETRPKELSDEVSSACTTVCGKGFSGKSCAKIQLVWIYPKEHVELAFKIYVIVDDQSTSTLGTSDLFDKLDVGSTQSPYILSTCTGKVKTWGRRVSGLVVESFDRSTRLDLPMVTECDYIPENRSEIPTPEIARAYSHLSDIELLIPPLDIESSICLLIGRDLLKAHHVLEQLTGSDTEPFAQRLPLGWTIVGETCLGSYHIPPSFNVLKTQIMPNGRPTCMEHCQSVLHVNDDPIFVKTQHDEKIGMSVEDQQFLDIVAKRFRRDKDGFWTSPLPFRPGRPRLDNNFPMALKRARNLQKSLLNDSVKASHFIEFMQKILKNGHAERAPPLQPEEECWFLPIFAVYNPQKPGQARVVFHSSAKFNGLSLNDILLTGPDLVNSLLEVLMRFRREPVAILADIQQMFFCFRVEPRHRNFLRFLWHEDSDLNKDLVQFRMCVHVFGNRPSPAVATYGLRLCVQGADPKVIEYIEKDFYVDDALASLPSASSAITLVKDAQKALMHRGNIRLHKIASNDHEVMAAFPNEDLAKDIKDLDLRKDSLPVQASLGVIWI